VAALREQFGVTERRACRVVGQPRSTQRLAPPVPADEELALRAFLRDFSRRRPRWGWRRAARAATDAGWGPRTLVGRGALSQDELTGIGKVPGSAGLPA